MAKNNINNDRTILHIYTLNDFHGMIFPSEDSAGISKIGKYLIDRKKENKESTLIISSGDMFQGSAVSNMSKGMVVVSLMNIIGFDAMTIGNHEFDWTIDTILKYNDNNTGNGELNCKYLACNIICKDTGDLAPWAKPYEVINRGKYKIGILGMIGSNLEYDIFKPNIEGYEFTDEYKAAKKYVPILRNKEKCDIVILSIHADTQNINMKFAELDGDQKIDAIINGHTHNAYYGEYNREGCDLPYVQSGCYGKYIGYIKLVIDNKTKKIIDCDVQNIKTINTCKESSEEIENEIKKYQEYIDIANKPIGLIYDDVNRELGGIWASDSLKNTFDADIGICNVGGIRASGFPLKKGQIITYGDIFEIMPFENEACLISIKGNELIKFFKEDGFYYSSNVDVLNNKIDGNSIDNNKLYKIATLDFIYICEKYPFINGINHIDTNILFRDVLYNSAKQNVQKNGMFKLGD